MAAGAASPAVRSEWTEDALLGHLGEISSIVHDREPQICALMAEAKRFERLATEALTLLSTPANRKLPLFGQLVGVKDIFRVDGLPTSAGSRLPTELFDGPESASVARLKAQGALILGKTVSTEFAYFGPGPTRNPHHPEHTPGGSSSGSAAAVAAGYCDLALGTQTIGSVGRPAAFCGVVGFKPTYERIPRDGLIPLSPSLDHVGIFARTVCEITDAAAVLCDDWNPISQNECPKLGVPSGPYLDCASQEGGQHFTGSCDGLRDGGWVVESVPVMADYDQVQARHYRIVAAEAATVHAAWFDQHRALYHPKTVELIEEGRTIEPATLERDLEKRLLFRQALSEAMQASGIDLWIAPAAPGPAPRGLESTGDPVMNLPWTQAGFPAISLPAGKNGAGLPLGLQVVANAGADETLLAWAQELESTLNQIGKPAA